MGTSKGYNKVSLSDDPTTTSTDDIVIGIIPVQSAPIERKLNVVKLLIFYNFYYCIIVLIVALIIASQSGYDTSYVNQPCQDAKIKCNICLEDINMNINKECDTICLDQTNFCSAETDQIYRDNWRQHHKLDYDSRLSHVYKIDGYYDSDGVIITTSKRLYIIAFWIGVLLIVVLYFLISSLKHCGYMKACQTMLFY